MYGSIQPEQSFNPCSMPPQVLGAERGEVGDSYEIA